MKVPQSNRRSSLQPPMTPMIDVVFLLLVFFVWTSSFDLPEFDLPGSIAQAQPPAAASGKTEVVEPPKLLDEVIVRIGDQPLGTGRYTWGLQGQTLRDRKELEERLTRLAKSGAQPPVVIAPDPTVPLGIAVELYDRVLQLGFKEVLFSANP